MLKSNRGAFHQSNYIEAEEEYSLLSATILSRMPLDH
jgi:hypothetical protein